MVVGTPRKVFPLRMHIELRPIVFANSEELLILLNDARVTKHMPLAETVDLAWVDKWKAEKSASWDNPLKGPWSVTINGEFAGWAGIQPDEHLTAELALVLHHWAWGFGRSVVEIVLETWKTFPESNRKLFVYFPDSRKARDFADRIGIRYAGTSEISGLKFEKFELLQS